MEPAAASSSSRVGTPRFHLDLAAAGRLRLRPVDRSRSDSALRKDYASLGAQVDLRFSVLHWYDMTLSVGYAVGYRGGRARRATSG